VSADRRLVFGVDRPEAHVTAWPARCADGQHLFDEVYWRCTICNLADPNKPRCDAQGCDLVADWGAEVGPAAEGPGFTTIVAQGAFCWRHVDLAPLALLPTEGPVQ
jgi:hypothetical protein